MEDTGNFGSTLNLYANHYYNLGFNITIINDYKFDDEKSIPYERNEIDGITSEISSKSPDHKWFHLKVKRQTKDELNRKYWNFASGIGTVLGFNELRAIDVDNCQDFNIIYNFLEILNLPLDYEWVIKSGSSKGFHILFYSLNHEFPVSYNQNKAFKSKSDQSLFERLELRWMGHLVLPPSNHRSGHEYNFISKKLPIEPPKRIESINIKKIVETYCSDEKVTGASGTFLDYGHSKISHNISCIDDDLTFQYKKPYYLIFDIETTGLIKNNEISEYNLDKFPRLVQIAWIIEDRNGKQIECCNFLIKPLDFCISTESIKIHKIENNIAYEHGVDLDSLLLSFRNRVGMADFLVCHNCEFDLLVLKSEYYRSAIWHNLDKIKKLCTMKMSLDLKANPFNNKYPKLDDLFYFIFSNNFNSSHNAIEDTIATAKCFRYMKNNLWENIE